MDIGRGRTVIVAGAGLAGTLIAILLARRGFCVEVCERRPDLRRTAGSAGRSINLALSTRGVRALAEAGLADRVLATTLPMESRGLHALDGAFVQQPYGQPGQAIRSVSRRLLNEALLDAAEAEPNVRLHFDCAVTSVDLDDAAGPVVHAETPGGGLRLTATFVIGADGVGSAVRDALARRPGFLFEELTLPHGYKELEVRPTADGGFALRPDCLHIWPRQDYMLIALPNADRTFTCTLFALFTGADSFAEADPDPRGFFQARFPDALPLLPDLEQQWARHPTSQLTTIACAPFHDGGRAVVVGDAAHAVVPFYGQGMNAAFESCSLLCRLLDAHDGDADTALPAFTAARKADADAIRQLALDNFVEMRASVADGRFLLRRRLGRAVEARAGAAFVPLYSMVSFSNLPYALALQLGRAREAWLDAALERLPGHDQPATVSDAAVSALADALAADVLAGRIPDAIRQPQAEVDPDGLGAKA